MKFLVYRMCFDYLHYNKNFSWQKTSFWHFSDIISILFMILFIWTFGCIVTYSSTRKLFKGKLTFEFSNSYLQLSHEIFFFLISNVTCIFKIFLLFPFMSGFEGCIYEIRWTTFFHLKVFKIP